MDPETLGQLGGWIGGILGALIGVAGGTFGTYCALRATKGPRERSFVIKAAILCWVFVIAFVAALVLIPGWYKHLLWIPYVLALTFGIQRWNKAQAQIREQEAAGNQPTT